MNRARIFELPPALCLNNAACIAALIARDDATMSVAKIYLGKSTDFSGSPVANYELVQTLQTFSWRGIFKTDYPADTLCIDLERGFTVQLDGPDVILDEINPFEALANKLLLFAGGEIMSVAGANLTAAGVYKLTVVRGRFGTPVEKHLTGDEVFILRLEDLRPVQTSSLLPNNAGVFKIVRGVDNLEDQNGFTIPFVGKAWNLPPPALLICNGQKADVLQVDGAANMDLSWVLPDLGASVPRSDVAKLITQIDFILDGAIAHTVNVAWPATSTSVPWTDISGGGYAPVAIRAITIVDIADAVVTGWDPLASGIKSLTVTLAGESDDSLAIYINGTAIRDLNNGFGSDPLTFDILALARAAGVPVANGDVVSFKVRDNFSLLWGTTTWIATVTFSDGTQQIANGGAVAGGASVGVPPVYYDNGQFKIIKP